MKPEQLYQKGVEAFERQEYDLAKELLGQLQAGDAPHFERALAFLGRISRHLGDDDLAVAYLRAAADRTETAAAHFELGDLLFRLERLVEAEACFYRAIAREARFTDAFIRLGMIHQKRGDVTGALRFVEHAIGLDPQALLARHFLAQLCVETGNKQRALSQLHVVLQIKPDHAPARLLMAELYQGLGDHRQALVELCALSREKPSDVAILMRMAKSFEAIGDRRQVITALERAYTLRPTLHGAGMRAATLREAAEQPLAALKLYQRLSSSPEHGPAARAAIARIEQALGIQLEPEAPADEEAPLPAFEPPPVMVAPPNPPTRQLNAGLHTAPLGRTAPARSPQTQELAIEPATDPIDELLDRLVAHLPDGIRSRIDLEALRRRIDLEGLKKRVDLDALRKRIDLEGLKERVALEALRKRIDLEGLRRRLKGP